MTDAEFSVFAPAAAGRALVAFDVLPLEFSELKDPSLGFGTALLRRFGGVCTGLEVTPERCSYYSSNPGGTVLEDRFPPSWRCRATVEGSFQLPVDDDGPWPVPGSEPQFETSRSISEWQGWPAELTIVGGFHGRAAAHTVVESLGCELDPSHVSLLRTGAGIELVRARVTVADESAIDAVVTPLLTRLSEHGGFVSHAEHLHHLQARRQGDDDRP